jgi:hypothetical protein
VGRGNRACGEGARQAVISEANQVIDKTVLVSGHEVLRRYDVEVLW